MTTKKVTDFPRPADAQDFTPGQTAQWVRDQILLNPQNHNQQEWLSPCGTTACVAGWTQYLHEGQIDHNNCSAVAGEKLGYGKEVRDTSGYFHQNEQALEFYIGLELFSPATTTERVLELLDIIIKDEANT